MNVPHIKVSKHYTADGCYADITMMLIIRDTDIETTIEDFVDSLKPSEVSEMSLTVEENAEIETFEGHTAYDIHFPRVQCEEKEESVVPPVGSGNQTVYIMGGRR